MPYHFIVSEKRENYACTKMGIRKIRNGFCLQETKIP